MDWFLSIFRGILDIIYPKRMSCLFCNCELIVVNDYELCSNCMSLLPHLNEYVCKKCGRPIKEVIEGEYCCECGDGVVYFDAGASAFEFSGIIQAALYRLKFDGDREAAYPIGRYMADRLKYLNWEVGVIVPVPLHEKRLQERGYNQSYLLALEVGRECGIDVVEGALFRTRYTESQVSLTKLQRRQNVTGAFAVRKKNALRGKSVLIVDDIMTTGSTLNECSRVAREDGAKNVYCLTAACPYYNSNTY